MQCQDAAKENRPKVTSKDTGVFVGQTNMRELHSKNTPTPCNEMSRQKVPLSAKSVYPLTAEARDEEAKRLALYRKRKATLQAAAFQNSELWLDETEGYPKGVWSIIGCDIRPTTRPRRSIRRPSEAASHGLTMSQMRDVDFGTSARPWDTDEPGEDLSESRQT